MNTSTRAYGFVAIVLHWLVAALVIVTWLLGMFGDDVAGDSGRSGIAFAHVSGGLAVLLISVARLVWRSGHPAPAPESSLLGQLGRMAGSLMHFALYATLGATIVAGIVLQFSRGDVLPVFGLFEIGVPWNPGRSVAHTVEEVHETLANLLMVLVGIHAAAALFHHWILRDGTLRRMLPGAPGHR